MNDVIAVIGMNIDECIHPVFLFPPLSVRSFARYWKCGVVPYHRSPWGESRECKNLYAIGRWTLKIFEWRFFVFCLQVLFKTLIAMSAEMIEENCSVLQNYLQKWIHGLFCGSNSPFIQISIWFDFSHFFLVRNLSHNFVETNTEIKKRRRKK